MRTWPKAWLVLAGGGLILAVNAIVLGGAVYNRSGDVQAQMRLSERELGLPYYWQRGPREENSGLALKLAWQVGRRAAPSDPAQGPNVYDRRADWLDAEKLRALGFRSPPEIEPDPGSRLVDRQPARSVWLLLEFDGESYRRVLGDAERRLERVRGSVPEGASVADTSRLQEAENALRQVREHNTRLFVIDAELDPVVLRRRYPDTARHLIARGRINTVRFRTSDAPEPLAGYIEAVDIDSVHVSTRFRPIFDALGHTWGHDGPPRYDVTLAWGRRFEPWIVDVQAIP